MSSIRNESFVVVLALDIAVAALSAKVVHWYFHIQFLSHANGAPDCEGVGHDAGFGQAG
jgi:hypothetical protein